MRRHLSCHLGLLTAVGDLLPAKRRRSCLHPWTMPGKEDKRGIRTRGNCPIAPMESLPLLVFAAYAVTYSSNNFLLTFSNNSSFSTPPAILSIF